MIVQAGASEPGQRLAARTAEVVFSPVKDFEKAKQFYKSLKGKLADFSKYTLDTPASEVEFPPDNGIQSHNDVFLSIGAQ